MAWQLLQKECAVTLIESHDRHGQNQRRVGCGGYDRALYRGGAERRDRARYWCRKHGNCGRKWFADLEKCTTIPIYYRALGTLVVAHGSDREDWRGFNSMAISKLGESSFQRLDRPRIRVLEPELAERFGEASYFPDEAVLSNHPLYQALNEALGKYGVNWLENHPVSCIEEVYRSGRFDWVIDCRGLGAFNGSF